MPYAEIDRNLPKNWAVRCTRCGERFTIQLPADTKPWHAGSVECSKGHMVVNRFDGVTVLDGFAVERVR